jgi:hypothetical protein
MAPNIPVRTIPPYARLRDPVVKAVNTQYGLSPAAESLSLHVPPGHSRWSQFMPATGGPPQRSLPRVEVARSQAILDAYHSKEKYNTTTYTAPKPAKQSRRPWWIQLVFRFFILFNSAIALGLGAGIYRQPFSPGCKRGGSIYLAIIVDAFAIPYTFYIAWDEFSSKPIGLRKPASKLRLLLLDLVFIVFEGANVSLAFFALSDGNNVCSTNGTCARETKSCNMQKGLVAVLMVALVAWLATFIMSLTRLMNIAWDRK